MIKKIFNKLASIRHYINAHGHYAFDRTGKNKLRQFLEILKFRRKGFLESEYYILSLYEGDKNYVSLREHNKMIRILNPPLRGGQIEFNKYIFSQYMLSHGLPTPECFGILHKKFGFRKDLTKLRDIDDLRLFLQQIKIPLVFKPVGDTFGGTDVFTLENYDHRNDKVRINSDIRISLDNFFNRLNAIDKSGVLIQEKIFQHPSLARIHTNSVNCVRIYSFINEKDKAEILGAIVKFGSGGAVVDNSKASGGVFAKVDIESGLVGVAYNFYDPEPMKKHPLTQEKIADLALPYWPEVKNITIKAHTALPFVRTFGWDIAIGEHGPIIIEANGGWDHNHFQKAMQQSLRETTLGQMIFQ